MTTSSNPTVAGELPAGQPAWNPQRSSAMPSWRYKPFHQRVPFDLEDRTWPSKRLERAPLWAAVDLRDGNQSLIDPMDSTRKRRMFDLLVRMGVKEIEVGFPASGGTDYDFVRELIEQDAIPDDVRIAVLTPARTELIERTFEALEGADSALVHLYTSTPRQFREDVLGVDVDGLRDLVVGGAEDLLRGVERLPGTDVRLQFSPETFILTEPEVALSICSAVVQVWDPTEASPIVLNLPSTVEVATPNVYADQIEWMDRNLPRREAIILSLHPHNDRGTGVASTELALLAGADRVEGCLFGNGERTGNADIVTLALNLHSQGIDPQLDFSDIDEIREVVEFCNQLKVPERHPYGGDLVFTSFSGSHQDAINKVFAKRAATAEATGVPLEELPWEVPYLPIDPHDVGRTYEAVIRVNSQSGKGGMAYLLKTEHGLDIPKRLQAEFSRVVQAHTDAHGGEVTPTLLWRLFSDAYLPGGTPPWGRYRVWEHQTASQSDGRDLLKVQLDVDGQPHRLEGIGNGPIDAFVGALEALVGPLTVEDYAEHAIGAGGDARAAAYVEGRVGDRTFWGVGIHSNIVRASLDAIVSAVNRATRELGSLPVA